MQDLEHKIDISLKQQPEYCRLDNLSKDVWHRIRSARGSKHYGFSIPVGFKMTVFALSLLAFIALSQVSFQEGRYQADIFDLRFFSYQSIPSVNLASVNTYEFRP